MKYKAVTFDLFGTLVDSFSIVDYTSVLRETSSILKIPHDDFIKLWNETSERRATGGFRTLEENLEYICRELNISVTGSQMNLARWVKYDYVALALTPRPNSIEVLSYLKSAGYKTALISNCSAEPPVIWPHTPFAPFFDVALFSSVAGIRKPDPRIFLLAAEKLGVKPQDCLYIGDDSSDELNGALGVGMRPVLVRNPNESADTHLNDWENKWQGEAITSLLGIPDLLK